MWEHYKKTFVRMQIFILLLAGVSYYYFKFSALAVVAAIVAMEIFSLLGAWNGARLKKQIEAQDPLPPKR